MPSIGADLPPHLLAKRKRQQEQQSQHGDGQTMLGMTDTAAQSYVADKRRRVVGPAMPPAPLAERPSEAAHADTDSDDDDFGPALPSGQHDEV